MEYVKGVYNQELQLAVRHLLGNGLITKDKDIAEKTKYNKSTVSGYITGKVKASEDFIKEFEKVFELSLDSFKIEGSVQNGSKARKKDYQVMYEGLLENYNSMLREYNECLKSSSSNFGGRIELIQGQLSRVFLHLGLPIVDQGKVEGGDNKSILKKDTKHPS